jgi:hypothetical protein
MLERVEPQRSGPIEVWDVKSAPPSPLVVWHEFETATDHAVKELNIVAALAAPLAAKANPPPKRAAVKNLVDFIAFSTGLTIPGH